MPASAYVGKCRTKGCRHATRVDWHDVQQLDSDRWATSARSGERVLLTPDGASYDHDHPFMLNGVAVCARCPDHGVFRLSLLRGRYVEARMCDARCMNATGPNCDCSCGGANHGASHAR